MWKYILDDWEDKNYENVKNHDIHITDGQGVPNFYFIFSPLLLKDGMKKGCIMMNWGKKLRNCWKSCYHADVVILINGMRYVEDT